MAASRTPTGKDMARHTSLTDTHSFERSRLAREQLDDGEPDWQAAFTRDVGLLGRIVRDILKLDQSVPGRPGPRPEPEVNERSLGILKQIMAEDYTELSFRDVFNILAGKRSGPHLGRLIGLSESQVGRLRRGAVNPSLDELTKIATAFGKHPSFFLEYRIAYITGAIAERLGATPEASIGLYRKLSRS